MTTLYLSSPYIQSLYKTDDIIRFYNHITKKLKVYQQRTIPI